jgi:hypothetical protein
VFLDPLFQRGFWPIFSQVGVWGAAKPPSGCGGGGEKQNLKMVLENKIEKQH